jgi:hypothetical protein
MLGARGSSFIDAPPDDFADYANFAACWRIAKRIAAYQVRTAEPQPRRGDAPDAASYVGLRAAPFAPPILRSSFQRD